MDRIWANRQAAAMTLHAKRTVGIIKSSWIIEMTRTPSEPGMRRYIHAQGHTPLQRMVTAKSSKFEHHMANKMAGRQSHLRLWRSVQPPIRNNPNRIGV